ncbi:MAG: RluA family pseudouridine synthase [Deltaproteobacteria bacterium]|nr:RluA family pseudouridine synthase [Deltaproteobacteria bacterium]
MHTPGVFCFKVAKKDTGKRLDRVIASSLPEYSRTLITNHIRNGSILVVEKQRKPGYRVSAGEEINGKINPQEALACTPEAIDIDILFEDMDIIVVNKPPGLVVHPAPGHYTGTLVNALLYHCPKIIDTGEQFRPGIVHRLDKDTSGLLVIAKTRLAHNRLAEQFKSRIIKKTYLALVYGKMDTLSGRISLPIGRHPVHRKKMSTISKKGRQAETIWKVNEYFESTSLIEINLKTGRTHQIRVHTAASGHPVVGDQIYGGKQDKNLCTLIGKKISRQMLHAWKLSFLHPVKKKMVFFEAPIPSDMQLVLDALRSKEGLTQSHIPGCMPL